MTSVYSQNDELFMLLVGRIFPEESRAYDESNETLVSFVLDATWVQTLYERLRTLLVERRKNVPAALFAFDDENYLQYLKRKTIQFREAHDKRVDVVFDSVRSVTKDIEHALKCAILRENWPVLEVNSHHRYVDSNRAYIKLAEMDTACPIVSTHKFLYFANLCCAPGGFFDYILQRKRYSALGYGVTLAPQKKGLPMRMARSRSDARRFTFAHGRVPIFECDIIDEDMRLPKVNLVLADGAVYAHNTNGNVRHNRIMREANVRLIGAEMRWSQRILRQNGNLLLKTFSFLDTDAHGVTTLDTIASINTAYRFERLVVLKSNHSRRTNDERYIWLTNFSSDKNNGRSNDSTDVDAATNQRRRTFIAVALHAELLFIYRRTIAFERIARALRAHTSSSNDVVAQDEMAILPIQTQIPRRDSLYSTYLHQTLRLPRPPPHSPSHISS